ncbi:hypothetical protein WDV85_16670 [Pseudokineococcus sp. 5B2Z-1]|uniref:hypothetical protein n=1 Tax=Pseudokineococcus sp. 5B2Z-1 TaxID=3132744 RepID=UPI0030A52C21
MTTTDPDTIESGLRALVDARMDAGRSLARAAAERDSIREALAAADAKYAGEHAAALSAGWTAEELKKVGLTAPTTTAPRRTRRRRAASTSDQPAGAPTEAQ